MSRQSKTIIVLYGALIVVVVVALTLCSGCAAQAKLRPTDASVSLGGALKGAYGHVESNRYDITMARKFMGKGEGAGFLDAADQEGGAAMREILVGMKQNDVLADEHNSAVAESGLLRGDIREMQQSARWRYGGWVVWGIRIIFVWAFIALAFPIAGLLLPGMWGTAIGAIGRIVNPIGWGHWYAEKVRIKNALYAQPPQS